MAIKTVTVSVHCKKNGKLSLDVDNWEVRGKKANADELEWKCEAITNNGTMKWIRIENPGSAANWPFTATPPDARYVGTPSQPATSGPLRVDYVKSPIPVRYGITVCFADDTDPNAERYAYIDPDMVFD